MARGEVPTTPPTFTQRDWGAMVRQAWGDAWHQREVGYSFSNGRKFFDPGGNGGPYTGEDGN